MALAPHPAAAPLLGAARRGRTAEVDETIAVADLGHTNIRTAVAERSGTVLTGLSLVGAHTAPSEGSPDEVEDAVANALIRGVRRAATLVGPRNPHFHHAPSRHVRVHLIVSLASHVARGIPVDDGEGVYCYLASE